MCTETSDPLAVDHPDGGFLLDGGELLVGVDVVERRWRGERGHCREVTGAVRRLARSALTQVVPQLLGQAGVRPVHVVPLAVGGGAQLVLLLGLHPPVLEPDLDLPLGQPEVVGDLYPPPPGEVSVEVELLQERLSFLLMTVWP